MVVGDVVSRTMRLLSLVATPDDDNPDRDQVSLVLDDGDEEHTLTFEGYPTLSLRFGSGGSLAVSFAVSAQTPMSPFENGLRRPSPE